MTDIQSCAAVLVFAAERNLGKWGMQDAETLALAIAEECGEIAQSYSRCASIRRFSGRATSAAQSCGLARGKQRAVDLGALCLQLMLTLNEEMKP